MRKPKKIKKPKGILTINGNPIRRIATHQKLTGGMWTHVVERKAKTGLLLAWKIQKALASD